MISRSKFKFTIPLGVHVRKYAWYPAWIVNRFCKRCARTGQAYFLTQTKLYHLASAWHLVTGPELWCSGGEEGNVAANGLGVQISMTNRLLLTHAWLQSWHSNRHSSAIQARWARRRWLSGVVRVGLVLNKVFVVPICISHAHIMNNLC